MLTRIVCAVNDHGHALLDKAVAEQLHVHGRVLPPWRVFPGEDPISICWRMGAGEWHIMVFGHWWNESVPREADRLAYFHDDEPPMEWLGWAATAIWPASGFPDDEYERQVVQRLADRGIGDYAAWLAWVTAYWGGV